MDSLPATPQWLQNIGGPLARWWLREDVHGRQHVPATGPVILAARHASHLDTVAVAAAAPRPLTFLGSVQLAEQPIFGSVLQALGMLVVNRGSADTDAMDRVLEVLDRGGAVVIYPEGGRTRDGRVYRPRSGVARLATAAGCPVVPVGIRGTREAWPVDQRPRVWRRHDVRVAFGQPLNPPDDDPGSRRDFASTLHDELVELSDAPRANGFNPKTSA